MSAGSKINNLSAHLQSQQFAISGAFHSASARISLSLFRSANILKRLPAAVWLN